MVIDDKHKEVQPAGWFVWMKSSIVGCGVSLSLALSLIRTYLNTSGSSGPRCPDYRRLLYFKHWAWLILSAVFMMALSLLDDRVLGKDNLDPRGTITLGGSEEEDSPQWNVSVLLGSNQQAAAADQQTVNVTQIPLWEKRTITIIFGWIETIFVLWSTWSWFGSPFW